MLAVVMTIPSVSQHGLTAVLFPECTILCLVFGAVYAACRILFPAVCNHLASKSVKRYWQTGFLSLFTFLYLAIAFYVLRFPGYVDPVEPMVASASYFAVHGRPVYVMPISYGPFCFLIYGAAMKLFGASITTLKFVVVAGNLAFLLILVLLYSKLLSWRAALLTVALILSACLMKLDYLVQTRGDLFICVAVALALLSALSTRKTLAVSLMAIALAVACGIKITALLYFLYPLALFWRRHGFKLLTMGCGIALILSVSPFLMRTVVLSDYLHWLISVSKHPRNVREFIGNIVVTCLLALPCLLAYWQFEARDHDKARRYLRLERFSLLCLLCGMVIMDVLASKIGAGRHHLLPFIPAVGLVTAQILQSIEKAHGEDAPPRFWPVYLWGCLGLVLFVSELSELSDVRALTTMEAPQAIAMQDDIRAILASFPGKSVEVGAGSGEFDLEKKYSPMYAAPQLVFAGNPYTFDPSAEADRNIIGETMPESDLQHVRSCETNVWLIPRGDTPFHSISIYSGMYPDHYDGRLLFPRPFERIFSDLYQRVSSSQFFDIYTCRTR